MKQIYLCLGVVAWLMSVSGCSNLPALLNEVAGTPKQFQSRQIIVALPEELRSQWQAINREILDRFDVQAAGEFPLASIRVNCLVYRVSETVDMDEIMRRLSADSRIELVQSNQVFAGLQASSSAYGALSYGPKLIHADLVHSKVTGKDISIAVIDTGADKEHPDLKGRLAATENFVEGGAASFAQDPHGTAVAGVIAARAGDGIGIVGIAPDARINVFKACWYADSGNGKALCSSWTLAKALDAAIKSGSRIINLSLGGPDDALLKKLLAAANRQHIALVAAALENSPEPGFPASLDFVIPVISADPNGDTTHPNWMTGYQAIAAPGVEILTTAPRNRYDFLSGSSLAAAHVSGVVALMLQFQPGLEPDAVKSVLNQKGQTKTVHQTKGSRSFLLIDACRALAALGAQVSCP
ncbi:MAG: S8 family peptidase [Methylococcaceae bacterium]